MIGKREELWQVFQMMNPNTNGEIGAKEVRVGLEKLGMKATDDQIRWLIDKTNDSEPKQEKTITFEDFHRFLMLIPSTNPRAVFDYWLRAVPKDIGVFKYD